MGEFFGLVIVVVVVAGGGYGVWRYFFPKSVKQRSDSSPMPATVAPTGWVEADSRNITRPPASGAFLRPNTNDPRAKIRLLDKHLTLSRNVVGRDPRPIQAGDLAVRLENDDTLSANHALIFLDVTGWQIQDISRFGTLKNKQKLEKEHPVALQNGDVIHMGKYDYTFHQANAKNTPAAQSGRRYRLKRVDSSKYWDLEVGEYSIGRDNDNTVVLANETVSRKHAKLRIEANGQVYLEDLGSTYGTKLGGTDITKGDSPALTLPCTIKIGSVELELSPV